MKNRPKHVPKMMRPREPHTIALGRSSEGTARISRTIEDWVGGGTSVIFCGST